jgi:hypothetical protein
MSKRSAKRPATRSYRILWSIYQIGDRQSATNPPQQKLPRTSEHQRDQCLSNAGFLPQRRRRGAASEKRIISALEGRAIQAVFPHESLQCAAVFSSRFGRECDISLMTGEQVRHVRAFELSDNVRLGATERFVAQDFFGLAIGKLNVGGMQDSRSVQEHRSLNDRLQLANISGPTIVD